VVALGDVPDSKAAWDVSAADLHAWVRLRDGGFRLSAVLVETAEEVALLAEARKWRDLAAFGCLGLVADFVRAHRGAGSGRGRGLVLVADGGDALQGGYEQTLRAIDRYNPDYRTAAGRSCKCSSYVAWYVRKGIQDERLKAGGLRMSALDHWARVEDAERELRHALGREPTHDEVVAATSTNGVETAARVSRQLRLAGAPPAPVDAEQTCGGLLPDEALEAEDVRREVDAVLPAGGRARATIEALAEGGPREAREVAGSRVAADEDVSEAREWIDLDDDDDDPSPVRVPRSPWRAIRPAVVIAQRSPEPTPRPDGRAPHLAGVMML
jgi:hypothetical protein